MCVSNFYIKYTSTSLDHNHGKDANLNSIYRIDVVCSWILGKYGNQMYKYATHSFHSHTTNQQQALPHIAIHK